jgi:hypothetical protein
MARLGIVGKRVGRGKERALTPAAATSDWRADAEAKGRAAFETATKPQPTPKPGESGLREYPTATRKKESQ